MYTFLGSYSGGRRDTSTVLSKNKTLGVAGAGGHTHAKLLVFSRWTPHYTFTRHSTRTYVYDTYKCTLFTLLLCETHVGPRVGRARAFFFFCSSSRLILILAVRLPIYTGRPTSHDRRPCSQFDDTEYARYYYTCTRWVAVRKWERRRAHTINKPLPVRILFYSTAEYRFGWTYFYFFNLFNFFYRIKSLVIKPRIITKKKKKIPIRV